MNTFELPGGVVQGQFVHLLPVGLIAYPIGWMRIFAPLWKRFVGDTHWLLSSAVYGAGLWVFAIGHIIYIVGLPFFSKFTGITWLAWLGIPLKAFRCFGCLENGRNELSAFMPVLQ